MLDRKAFLSIPNYLEVGSEVAGHCNQLQNYLLEAWRGWSPVLFLPREEALWKFGTGRQDLRLNASLNSATLMSGIPASRTSVAKPPVESSYQPHYFKSLRLS